MLAGTWSYGIDTAEVLHSLPSWCKISRSSEQLGKNYHSKSFQGKVMCQYSRFLSISSRRWPTSFSPAYKENFLYYGQEFYMTSTCSSVVRGGPCLLVERIFIPGFIRALATLDIYCLAHCLTLGNSGRDFPFSEDKV